MKRIYIITMITGLAVSLHAEEPIHFNRDVRPILTKNCTTCHGGVMKAGEVSFLYEKDVLGKGQSGKTVVVPGDPGASEMIRLIKSKDENERMPPIDHHPEPLSQKDIDTLTKWVEQGAKWDKLWSFEKPVKSDLPVVKQADWVKKPLDNYVLAQLEQVGMQPSEEADLAQWLRRTSFDLTGLPPSVEELEKLEAEAAVDREKAMEAVVNRLLASPAYGERWAALWLDLARYADTGGYEKDPNRPMWPWRDWVIRAFNEDMPYDVFTVKQLAGDLLPDPEPFDLLATGFHRNSQTNNEGGTDDEEFRMVAVIDRVNTTWTAWNGLTFGCVQCHDHPYEAIPHENYYEFLAFFNNDEDVDFGSTYGTPAPHEFPHTKVTNDLARQKESIELEKKVRITRKELNDDALVLAKKIEDWKLLRSTKVVGNSPRGKMTQNEAGDFVNTGEFLKHSDFIIESAAIPFNTIRYTILGESKDPKATYKKGAVVGLLEVKLVDTQGNERVIPMKEVISDFLAGPFEPNEAIKGGPMGFGDYPIQLHPSRTAWFVPAAPVVVNPGDKLVLRSWHHITSREGQQDCVPEKIRIELSEDQSMIHFVNSPERIKKWGEWYHYFTSYNQIPGIFIPTLTARHHDAKRKTWVHLRGNRLSKGEEVEENIPDLFETGERPKNRLEMARWLVSKDNPLAARVLVNRLWAELFGVGIVETLGDFGSSGAVPSNALLLDHLALRLQDDYKWHLKPFLKELVLSAAYRQTNKMTAEAIEKDPKNRLIGRGPRQRLTGEMVRDQALKVSGLLSPKMYGLPVFPPQPAGVWNTVYNGAAWPTSQGEDRYRRAMYTFIRKTAGFPGLLTFDAPSREFCEPQRIATNTPLQALLTLNDPAHIEFAQAYAKKVLQSSSDVGEQLRWAYKQIALKDPSAAVLESLKQLHAELAQEYKGSPEQSSKLAATPEEAAMVMVANTLLNSDIALNR